MTQVDTPVVHQTADGRQVIYEVLGAPKDLQIDQSKPWAQWAEPKVANAKLSEMIIQLDWHENDIADLVLYNRESDELINRLTLSSLAQLGTYGKFPASFVTQLTPLTAKEVINECLGNADDREMTVISDGDRITNFMPGSRELIPYHQTAQFVHDTLSKIYGSIATVEARANGRMRCRFTTGAQDKVTTKKGDILSLGVTVEQSYGGTIELDLYAERLICLNGMTSNRSEFKWAQKSGSTRNAQFAWLRQGMEEVTSGFENLLTRARLMAQTTVVGDPEKVLIEHAKAMNLPQRFWADLLAAFREEPGNTEWDLLNAFTRLATHGGLEAAHVSRVQGAAGSWVEEFDMVTARLPRPMAHAVGAEIMS